MQHGMAPCSHLFSDSYSSLMSEFSCVECDFLLLLADRCF